MEDGAGGEASGRSLSVDGPTAELSEQPGADARVEIEEPQSGWSDAPGATLPEQDEHGDTAVDVLADGTEPNDTAADAEGLAEEVEGRKEPLAESPPEGAGPGDTASAPADDPKEPAEALPIEGDTASAPAEDPQEPAEPSPVDDAPQQSSPAVPEGDGDAATQPADEGAGGATPGGDGLPAPAPGTVGTADGDSEGASAATQEAPGIAGGAPEATLPEAASDAGDGRPASVGDANGAPADDAADGGPAAVASGGDSTGLAGAAAKDDSLEAVELAPAEAAFDAALDPQPAATFHELPTAITSDEAAPNTVQLLSIMGLDTHRRNNVLLIDDDTLVTCIGSHVLFLSLSSGTRRYLRGLDGGGVGAVAVHPSRSLLAVGEKSRNSGGAGPCVYIYSYPELRCVKVLRGGTERAYSALAFDSQGTTLASVGSFPDFLLTLWDWKSEAIVLRAKAFSQDVYTVAFSPYFDGQLTTSGQGHIRFWRMASTFTGLKLQGAIGKFGNVELSDVAAFVELPDGKVLSTTEGGELLLWDAGLIKVVLTRPGGRPCHDGPAEVLLHDRASGIILSAGADGYVRVWDFSQVNDAEPPEDGPALELQPLDEVLVASGAHLVSLVWHGRRWVAVDRGGNVYVVALPASGSISKGASVACVAAYPAGAVAGLALSPQSHVGLSASRDGQLRVLDYRTGAMLAECATPQAISAFAPLLGAVAGGQQLASVVTGYRDGVVRVYARCSLAAAAAAAEGAEGAEGGEGADAASSAAGGGLVLLGVAKPHKAAVSVLAVSRDASRLATCGEDGTVFFFDISLTDASGLVGGVGGVLLPRAFVRLPASSGSATCATWDAAGELVLVGTSRGAILQVPLPPSDLNTHHSFEWGGAVVPSYAFCAPRPERPKKKRGGKGKGKGAEGDGQAADGGDGGAEGEPAERKTQDGDGAAGEDGEGGGDEGDEGGQEEAEAEGADVPASGELLVLALAPDDPSSLLVTVGGASFMARKVWRVRVGDPAASPVLDGFASAPVTSFGYSGDGTLAMLGSADGLVRLQPLDGPYGAPSGACWESPLHDMQFGRVTAMALSFDSAYLLTAAQDGSVHLLSLRNFWANAEPQERPHEALPLPAALPPPPSDMTASSAYTLEEEKQQAERDQQMREAEDKKLSVRERLRRIRTEYEALLAENDSQPEALRLGRQDFEVDPGLRELMEAEARRREEVARLELAWESERQRLGLAKLRHYFLDGLESERVVLYSLRGGSTITTFRIVKLSPEALAGLAAARAAAASSSATGGADGAGRDSGGNDARKGSETGGGPTSDAAARARLADATAALEEGTASGKLNKADIRRLARKRRDAEWAAFNATRPDETYDSPADLRAIEEAQRTIGDFKLKSDPNFVVPEEERMTPQRKRHAMLELEEALYAIKSAFNKKFFALRDVKRKVLSDIHAKLAALAELATAHAAGASTVGGAGGGAGDAEAAAAAYLAQFSAIPPALLPDERPEDAREAVTDKDLEAFALRKEEEERKAAAAATGGLGGFAATGVKRPAPGAHSVAGVAASHGGAITAGGPGTGGSGLSPSEEALAKMMAVAPQSELEKSLAAYNRRRVEHMRSKLTDEVNSLIEAFDDAHGALKAEKLGLEADVKAGEMQLLVALQELQLLREFDKRESVLLQKRQAKLDDKQEIVDKITECTDKLEQKRAELEGLVARRAAVVLELDSVVPESDPFREALVRVFHRRIKRSKKKAGGGDDDYDSDEDEEDDEMGDDEADDDDDGGEEVCPPGCDQSVYERVCDLREKRLDEEDMIAEFQKTIEVLRKEKEALAKKQRLVEQGLAAVNADMAEFQKEKQGRLNQVEVVVSLKMNQIEYLLDGCLPDDLSAALVFSAAQLRRLQRRVDELEDEKAALRAAHKDLKREHTALLRDKADKEKKVSELETRAHDVQMLKFGQVIDLDLLDRVSSSRGTEDLKEELRKQELRYGRELADWDARISSRMDELVALTRENTACLNAVSELTSAQRKLEGGLTATRKGLFADPVQQRKAEVEERDALVQLVNAQAQEIDRLKAQLMALRRKDTSMYT